MIDLPKKEDVISDHSDSWRCWMLSQATTGCTSSDAGWDRNLRSYFGLKRAGAENKLDRMHDFMHRHGHLGIFYARFSPGFRALVYLSAGAVRVPPSRFFFYDLAGQNGHPSRCLSSSSLNSWASASGACTACSLPSL